MATFTNFPSTVAVCRHFNTNYDCNDMGTASTPTDRIHRESTADIQFLHENGTLANWVAVFLSVFQCRALTVCCIFEF